MSRVTPIKTVYLPPRPAARPRAQESATEGSEDTRAIIPLQQPATQRRVSARPGPSTPFLTQYVDQHWPWPRNAEARVQARGKAAAAYRETDDAYEQALAPTELIKAV